MTHKLKEEKIPTAAETPRFAHRITLDQYENERVEYTQNELSKLYKQMNAAKHFKVSFYFQIGIIIIGT